MNFDMYPKKSMLFVALAGLFFQFQFFKNALNVSAVFNILLVYLSKGFYVLQTHDINSQLIILEVLFSTLGYVLLFVIIKMVGAMYYTLVNTITALTGVVYGYFIFNQRYSNSIYLAITLVIFAFIILTAAKNRLER